MDGDGFIGATEGGAEERTAVLGEAVMDMISRASEGIEGVEVNGGDDGLSNAESTGC